MTVLLLNAYYLQEAAALDLRAGRGRCAIVEEVLEKTVALGAAGLRTNAFNDGEAQRGRSALQLAPLQYDEVSWRGLDLVLSRARERELKLVLPLGNFWNAYGGVRRYVKWAGLPQPVEGDPRFFSNPRVVDHYRVHLRNLLERVNTFDGIRYGEHPAVLAWELLNEPRGTGLGARGERLREWVDAVGAVVREHAKQWISTGEEGFETSDCSFRLNTSSPFVDVASIHLYPESWSGKVHASHAAVGAAWISERARTARDLGKPLMLGEFGLRSDGRCSEAERVAAYRDWLDTARCEGLVAAAPWLFAHDTRPAEWDPHSFYLRADRYRRLFSSFALAR